MDRAGRVLRNLKLPGDCADQEALARAAWPAAVGKRIAGRTRPVSYVDGCLTIEVHDHVWFGQLQTMYAHILGRLQEIAGKDVVRTIRLRQGVPRMEPRRAGELNAAGDEAESIDDPVLRRIYRNSRKRSLA